MAYRFAPASNPILRCSIGAFNGYSLRPTGGTGMSAAALLKRNSTGAWQAVQCIDDGTNDYYSQLEFHPTDSLIAGDPNIASWLSAATFADTTNWMTIGFTWNGGTANGSWIWYWKIGAGSWNTENETPAVDPAAPTTIGSAYRWMIGNVVGLSDDGDYDLVCTGAIKGALSTGSFESLDMAGIASWDAVFTGSSAWLIGCDAITSRTDRTGNGGNELSRSGAGITLVSDPPGWSWGGAASIVSPLVLSSATSSAAHRAASI